MLDMSNVLILNTHELRLLESRLSLNIRETFNKLSVIETKGKNGASLRTEEQTFTVPAYKVPQVKNTSGAGDAFAATFVRKISEGHNYFTACLYSSASASLVVEQMGCQIALDEESITARYELLESTIT
jgi:sugar/nucleoside kinase (ribokinase family)